MSPTNNLDIRISLNNIQIYFYNSPTRLTLVYLSSLLTSPNKAILRSSHVAQSEKSVSQPLFNKRLTPCPNRIPLLFYPLSLECPLPTSPLNSISVHLFSSPLFQSAQLLQFPSTNLPTPISYPQYFLRSHSSEASSLYHVSTLIPPFPSALPYFSHPLLLLTLRNTALSSLTRP
jgi:hypothetical protein